MKVKQLVFRFSACLIIGMVSASFSCKGNTYENEASQGAFFFDIGSAVRVSNLSTNTSENGQSGTFTVYLTALPTADVIIAINEKADSKNSSNQEGTVNKNTLTFTPANYNSPQTVTVTGVDDNLADGNIQYTIQIANAVSSDPVYNGKAPSQHVTVNNNDNDIPGFEIVANPNVSGFTTTTLTGNTSATISGLATDDLGTVLSVANYSTFTVRLRSVPTANVVVTLSVSTTSSDGTLDKTSLTFTTTKDAAVVGTTSGWNVAQTVQVTGASNGANEGSKNYSVNFAVTTTDAKYSNTNYVALPSISLHSCDNDNAPRVVACRRSGSFGTSEAGGSATLWYITSSAPANDITLTVSRSDATEGAMTRSGATITSANWNTMTATGTNRVTVQGADDSIFDGDIIYTLTSANTSSADATFNNLAVLSTDIVNADDEKALTFTAASGNTTESGTTATFGIRLANAPTASVTFSVACNTAECQSVSPTSLTFTTGNYATPQTITITPADDNQVDGNRPQCVSFGAITTTDVILTGVTPPGVCPMNNVDNDRLIWITTTPKNGNYNAGMAVADSNCNDANDANFPSIIGGTYKALMADSTTRVATTNGADATGQLNWVLAANTSYYLKSGSGPTYGNAVFTTNAFGLFSFGALTTAFTASGADNFWTGLNTNWTTATNNCSNWTSNTPGVQGQYGIGNSTTSASISSASNGDCGNDLKKLICVQQ